jgi:hypothetical protein
LIQLNFWLGVGCLKVGLNELLISPLIARWGSNVARVGGSLLFFQAIVLKQNTTVSIHIGPWILHLPQHIQTYSAQISNYVRCVLISLSTDRNLCLQKKPIQSSTTMTYFAACQKNWRNHLIQFGDLPE